jgi:hypothetical protein
VDFEGELSSVNEENKYVMKWALTCWIFNIKVWLLLKFELLEWKSTIFDSYTLCPSSLFLLINFAWRSKILAVLRVRQISNLGYFLMICTRCRPVVVTLVSCCCPFVLLWPSGISHDSVLFRCCC